MLLAYLFGSLAARNQRMERPPGDVDLAILTREGLTLGCTRP
ncbi:MAG: hypothetical protein GKC10_08590 [Methanosarcinales archaeon]|nr:hypothetical protein [Methanosarcinales archaeon]